MKKALHSRQCNLNMCAENIIWKLQRFEGKKKFWCWGFLAHPVFPTCVLLLFVLYFTMHIQVSNKLIPNIYLFTPKALPKAKDLIKLYKLLIFRLRKKGNILNYKEPRLYFLQITQLIKVACLWASKKAILYESEHTLVNILGKSGV
jgi:hypothetical protein